MANKHRKICVMILIIKHMQIKPTAVPPHTHIGYYQKTQKTTSVGKKEEKLESLHIVGGTVKWGNCYGKQLYGSFSKIKSTVIWSSHSTSGYTLPKHLKQGVVEIFVHSYAIPALFTIAKRWMQSKCPSMNKWIYKTWYRHANGRIFSLEKKFWYMPQPGWNLWANIQPYLQTCLIFKLQNDLFFF